MGITLSHISALDATRALRSAGRNIPEMDAVALSAPSTWRGVRWSMRLFGPSEWRFAPPDRRRHLHVLVPQQKDSVRMTNVESHCYSGTLPRGSIVWLDTHASMVCPELLFLQMANVFSLPALVMLGYELCGNFSRSPDDPLHGDVATPVPAATSVERIADFLKDVPHVWGVKRARQALGFVSDNALSAPEALIATMYSLPEEESGYGIGPTTLNARVRINDDNECVDDDQARSRYPDLLFPFARVGINYDGGNHLDLSGLISAAQSTVLETEKERHDQAVLDLLNKREAVRNKYIDDNLRDRQLASRGYLVLRATKEDIESLEKLDAFTRDLLRTAQNLMGIDVSPYLRPLDDTSKTRDRKDIFDALRFGDGSIAHMHGKM